MFIPDPQHWSLIVAGKFFQRDCAVQKLISILCKSTVPTDRLNRTSLVLEKNVGNTFHEEPVSKLS